MKLRLKQKMFSWLDSYKIYNDHEELMFQVKGKLHLGHRLVIYNAFGEEVGEIVEEVLTFLPKFSIRINQEEVGCIKKELSFFKDRYTLSCNDWEVQGDFWDLDYEVYSPSLGTIMKIEKEWLSFTDTYTLNILHEEHMLLGLMIALAIDAAKCSSTNN